MLSVEPLAKAPVLASVEVLFIIVPSDKVSNTKGDKPLVGPPEPVAIVEDQAAVNEPVTTRVTNKVVPPSVK